MSGKRYQVFMAPSAHRRYKKFDPLLKEKIKEEANKLSEDPHRYEELKGPLRGIRSYHFDYSKTQYRIAYRILEERKQRELCTTCQELSLVEKRTKKFVQRG